MQGITLGKLNSSSDGCDSPVWQWVRHPVRLPTMSYCPRCGRDKSKPRPDKHPCPDCQSKAEGWWLVVLMLVGGAVAHWVRQAVHRPDYIAVPPPQVDTR